MRLLFIIISLFLFSGHARSQDAVRLDSSAVDVRQINKKDLAAYRDQEAFNYNESSRDLSAWDRFWIWFWRKVDKIFSGKGVKKGVDIFVWTIAILLVGYAIYRFAGMEKIRMFREAGKKDIVFKSSEEDVRQMDLPAAIEAAEAEADHRLALRLQYLYSLRQLSDRNLIDYTIHKTNHDYARELAGGPYASSFSRITQLYEFGWYGEFPITKDMYQRIREIFSEHRKTIQA